MGFRALVLERDEDDNVTAAMQELQNEDLPEGEVTVRITYSTLNYKDGLVLNGLGNLVRNYPHVGGIDFAGTVEASDTPAFEPGDEVVLTGWRVGEAHWGGFAQKARVKAEWLVRLPDGMSARQAMAIGTAGFTAMLSVLALGRQGLKPGAGEVVVTGASGGVGSVAVALLAGYGHEVVAATGREETHDYLKGLGAATIMDRSELADAPKKPLLPARFAAAVDCVGGTTLATVLAMMKTNGAVAACGLAGSMDLPTSVAPFILRGVSLLGIESVMCPMSIRKEAWARLATDLPAATLEGMTSVVPLSGLPELGSQILKGQIRGRTVVDVNE